MAKNIVICSDGTGNTTIKGRGTNVFKLFEAVDLNGHRWDANLRPQVAFYDDGVGTDDFKPLRILGGAAGWGLSKNVRQLYRELARVYDPGDRIYMFGFSRGAFTVRTLAGLLGTCGLVDIHRAPTAADLDRLVHAAYDAYRACYQTTLARGVRHLLGRHGSPRQAGSEFAAAHGVHPDPRIHFIGVWDTVDAVGLPFHLSDIINATVYRYKFPDHFLSSSIDHACHALSIDDDRQSFHPLLWNERKRPAAGEEGVEAHDDRVEQVWFAGVHSNVGGGYPKQGLSLVALDWMMAKAEQHGLRFNCRDRDTYRDHSSVDDKLYDPRAGLGTFYRWKPRDIGAMCRDNGVDTVKVHISAIERIAHGADGYAPVNLPRTITVVATPPDRQQDATLMTQRSEGVQRVWDTLFPKRALLDRVRRAVRLGWLSYYVFLVACTVALIAIVALDQDVSSHAGLAQWTAALSLVGGFMTSPLDTSWRALQTLWAHPRVFWPVVSALLASSVMSRSADARIGAVGSRFWHQHQQALRVALKTARAGLGGAGLPRTVPLCWSSDVVAASGADGLDQAHAQAVIAAAEALRRR